MQIPSPENATDFYREYPFTRENSGDDSQFYSAPRLVKHLDTTAISEVESIYGRLLSPATRVLDLMSSCASHIPESLNDLEITGLGLNKTELQANRDLARSVVHDLNRNPLLPFADNEFDATICTVSIEYLVRPLEVLAEVSRVTKPGGRFVTIISDRWFPGKEIICWKSLHPFERFGLLLDYYLKTPLLENLHTESIIGRPRPFSDNHIARSQLSDPIFAVWGTIGDKGR